MNQRKAITVRTSDYTRAGHAAFQQKFSFLVRRILSRPEVFTDLPIPPAELEAVAKNLLTATNEANNGGSRTSKNERNILRAQATSMLMAVGARVAVIAFLTETEQAAQSIMNLSGFEANKTKYDKISPPAQVQQVKGTWTGKFGQAFIQWNKIRAGVSTYNVEITFSNPGEPEWHFVKATSRSKVILDNLPHLSTCWVRVTAIGSRNKKSVPSAPALISMCPVAVR